MIAAMPDRQLPQLRRPILESEDMAGQKDKILGGFRVLEEIQAGSGSQGTVYKAVCEDAKHGLVPVGTVVALKVMAVQDEGGVQWRKLQKRTAELAKLDHPNVVKYHGCFSESGLFNDVHVVVQEFLQGETLKEKLAKRKTGLDVDEGLRVVDSALAGLEYTAGCGLVHRDVKPGNIFLCDDGGVKLIDFEIAKQEGGTATASVGNIRGSFDYMAPDFTNAEFHGDVQSDVFSMGVVLHEVLSGKTPYERLEGDDKQANFAFLSRWSQTVAEGHSPIHISSRIKRLLAHADEVLMQSLAQKREDRYQDFTAFRAGLKTIRFRSLKSGSTSYQLLQFIGKGGFGEVFKARNRQTGQLVAVKHLMKSAYAERFYREAKIMKKLTSPCFVRFVDFFMMESGGGQEAFLVMAFLDGMPGSSLRDAIKRRAETPMAWRDVFVAFERYVRGLLAMHQQGIFHRDIKPSNLYYPPGHPELSAIMDLGIARDVNGTATTGQVPGTLDYMPPEVVTTDNRGDGGMDIYALGLCLYEALTGKMAFPRLPSGSTAYATFFDRARSKRSPVFDAPEVKDDAEILSLLTDMTNPDIAHRLRNAGVLLKRLQTIIESRFGEGSSEPDYGPETVAPTLAMPNVNADGDAGTIATSVLDGSGIAAFAMGKKPEPEKRRGLMFAALAAGGAVLLAAGVAVYTYRTPIMAKFQSESKPKVEEAQKTLKAQQDALKAQQEAMEKQRRELEEQQKKLDAERKAEAERKKIEEAERKRQAEEDQKKADAEEARILADKTKTAAEKAAEAKRIAEDKAKREAERKAEEALRKQAEEEAQKKLKAEQDALKAQQEAMEKQRKELEEQQKRLEAERKAEADRKKAEELAAEDKKKSDEDEARKKLEAEMAAMKKMLAEREAEAKKLEEERKRAEEERKFAEEAKKKAEAEAARIAAERKAAEERAAKEKAEREAAAKKLEDDRRKFIEAQKKAKEEADRIAAERKAVEEARKKAEAQAARITAEKSQRESSVKDLVSKAELYFESEDYYDVVKYYHEAVKGGYSMNDGDLGNFKEAYERASEKLKLLKTRCEEQIRLGQTPIRGIKELEEESKNLVDWRIDVLGR